MISAALPLTEQVLLDVVAPPVATCLWWLMARGWAASVQGGEVSSTTKKRQKWEFFAILIAGYLLVFGITIYGHFAAGR
jgi:bacteriorhodopsin